MQEQATKQNSMYICQLSDLEPTVSQLRSELTEAKRMYEDKTEELEKQLSYLKHGQNVISSVRNPEIWMISFKSCWLTCRREKELSLEKEQNKRLWDRVTRNSITIDHLLQVLDDRNLEVQHLEALLNSVKNECQGQMEWQMQQFREGTKV
ncbi:hypothetical protein MC885_012381 [Smutsia gigantea]|nr:hypothetical protein MC885_012381 [Smutsia gigantea]